MKKQSISSINNMKKTCFKTVMLVVAWCCTMGAWAYDFEADGIYYGITSATDKTVEVVSGSARYSGDVTIPATVTYGGITYRVMLLIIAAAWPPL